MSKSFESVQKDAINLELELQQCKEKIKDDMSIKVNKSKDFCKEREQYLKIEDLKAQLQDKGIVISELKKLMEKQKGKYVDTKFEKSSVIRQPNAFKSQRPSILGKPTTFSNSFVRKDFLKSTSVTHTHVPNDFSKPVTAQILPANTKSILKNTNVLNPGMYKIHTDHTQTRTSKMPPDFRKTNKRVTFSTGVILSTSVSRPQFKSNPMEDRVLRNNGRGKKQEVEDHRRNVKLPKNKMSVTACHDSLNAKTLNVKSVSMCDKCELHDKHDMCVLKYVAKPIKRIVASESNKNLETLLGRYMSILVRHVVGEIVLFIVDFGSSKYMTRNLKLLINFVEKFLGTVKFGNDQIAPILGYGDLGNDLLSGNIVSSMLWHRRLSHLNFDTINLLSKNDIVVGLPKVKFVKDHLCSSCELRKANQKSFQTKLTPSLKRRLQLLHMDLCGPMRVASINGKRYVLVIVDDYSRYTWTHFLKSKDETPEVLIDFLRFVQRGLQAQVGVVRTDKGTEFLNQTLHAYFAAEGIQHQTSVARTPEQNGEIGHVARECQKLKRAKDAAYHREKMLLCKQEKPKRAKDAAYHREKMLLCKQEVAGIQLNAEQADWRDDTDDDELEDQELEAHYMYMAQLQEVSPDAADSGPIFDDEPVQKVSNDDHYNVFAMESVHPEHSKSIHDTEKRLTRMMMIMILP
uniref:Integrase catalytic domain-containing protein n=1 Tax=Tanacetum cinerariifolium TaxID=118510 RepID=A0A6L2NH79_TANCI|nr:hypothetical protein [Tanacetum cinerariifolium]